MDEFNVSAETQRLKQQTKAIRKPSYKARRSRLDRFTAELLALHRSGCTVAELQRWLRAKRIKVAHTTVTRWLVKNG